MAFDISTTLETIESYLSASGHVGAAQVGEPKHAPSEALFAAIYMTGVSVVSTTLNKTIEVHTITIRLYADGLADPASVSELALAQAVSQITGDLLGEFDLGATIRNVDVAGQYGGNVSTQWGYVDVAKEIFRVADITLPLIVDDSATFAP